MKRLNDPFAPTPEGFHLRVEQTLNGLEEREMTRRKFTASLAFAMVLVLIMTAAAVAGVSGGYVGWDGVIHYYEDEDATVEPVDPSVFEKKAAYDNLFESIPRGEWWTVTKDGEEVAGMNRPDAIYDEETFLALIEGTELPVPSLPGGYQLLAVSILTEPEDTPYEEITLEDGAVLSKYKLKAPVAGKIDNYDYHFTHKDGGNAHFIHAEIVPASEHLTDGEVMHVNDHQTAEAVEVEGFEYGLYVHDSEFGDAQCLLLDDMGDRMLRVDITAFEDLPKEAVLNLFNPEGNIDLSSSPSPASNDSGVDFTQMPAGEYWLAAWKPDEAICESRRNDTKIDSFDEIARLTANKKLPVPVVPDEWSVIYIFSMAPVEAEPFEEVEAENDYVLRKYRLQEVAEGDLEHYRFLLNTPDGSIVFGEVFPDSEMEFMESWIYMPDFTAAESLSHPAFDEILTNPASHANDNTEYLFTAGDVRVYMHTDADVPAESVLALFPAE